MSRPRHVRKASEITPAGVVGWWIVVEPSPLERSEARGLGALVGLLLSLAGVMNIAAVLIFALDEGEDVVERGLLMAALAGATGATAGGLSWWSRRPRTAPVVAAVFGRWRRRRLGPAWTDWLAPAIPVALGGGLIGLREAPMDADAWLGTALVVGFLELVVVPAFVVARRELVGIDLVPEGVRLSRRSGREALLRRGEVARVRLASRTVRGFSFGILEIHPASGRPLVLREPMDAPLGEIARAVAAHLGVPLDSDLT